MDKEMRSASNGYDPTQDYDYDYWRWWHSVVGVAIVFAIVVLLSWW